MLWPESDGDRARQNLFAALNDLRRLVDAVPGLAIATEDGRYAFTTNFADGAVSRWAIGGDGSITLEDATAGVAVDGQPGLRDEDLTRDGRFLYAVDADSRRVFGWAVKNGGTLDPVGSWAELPATAAGLAAS